MPRVLEGAWKHVDGAPVFDDFGEVDTVALLVFAGNVGVFPVYFASFVEDDLGDAFADWEDDRLVLVDVADFHGPAVDVSGIAPTGIEADGDTVAPPSAASLHSASARGFDTDKLMSVGKDAFARAKHDDGVIHGDVGKFGHAALFDPGGVRDGLERPREIAGNFALVERVIDARFFVVLDLEVVVAESDIDRTTGDVGVVEGLHDDMFVLDCVANLAITVDSHSEPILHVTSRFPQAHFA